MSRLNRLRHGELLALVGMIGLAVVMCLRWYDAASNAGYHLYGSGSTVYSQVVDLHTTGWAATGWFAAGVTALALAVTVFWLFTTVRNDSPALPVAAEVVTIGLGLMSSIALTSRLVLQPGLGIGLGNAQVDLRWPAYAGPALAILLTVGAWRATADERTEAPYSQPGEIELRAIPE